MKKPVNDFDPCLKIDRIDSSGWRWYDPNDYYDAVVRTFLEGFQEATDRKRHVLNCFHECINDQQMRIVLRYFDNYHISFDKNIFGDEEGHMKVLKEVYFQAGTNNEHVRRNIIFGFDRSNYYQTYRISTIHELHNSSWLIRRTIFTANTTICKWQISKYL